MALVKKKKTNNKLTAAKLGETSNSARQIKFKKNKKYKSKKSDGR